MNKRIEDLRVIGVPWHVAHQYELAKIFKQYDLLVNMERTWGEKSRPMPENMNWVVDYKPGKYDLAILHVDQQAVLPRNRKGQLFRSIRDLITDIPVVVINHMTPFDDHLEQDELIFKMKQMVGDLPMITNSKQAAEQWGWGTPIIHGMDPDEWTSDLPKEPRAVCFISKAGMNKAYRRELLEQTIEILEERGINLVWIGVNKKLQSNNFDQYRDLLGRSLIYFNPTWQSPMPRSRTEAMFSGCCIISTRHHDWSDYIEDGVNGFIVKDNPHSAADLITRLLTTDYKEALEVGRRGRETAIKEFHIDRWKADWSKFLSENTNL